MFTLPVGFFETPATTARPTANSTSVAGTAAAATNIANMYDGSDSTYGQLYAGTDFSGSAYAQAILTTIGAGIPTQYCTLQILADWPTFFYPTYLTVSFDSGGTFPLSLNVLPYAGTTASASFTIDTLLIGNMNTVQVKLRTGNTSLLNAATFNVYDVKFVYA